MTSSRQNKVLFISHEATRTGAPIVLLHLLKWLKSNTPLQFDILLLNDGPLRPDFEVLGKTYIAQQIANQHSYTNRLKKKLFKQPVDIVKKAVDKLGANKYSLIYGNTILSLPWLNAFKERYAAKTICCIHELPYALNYCFNHNYLAQHLPLVDKIIAVSGAVKDNLLNTYHLPHQQVELQYEFIDTALETDTDAPPIFNAGNSFIIGMGGTPEWRKGTDLIIPLTQNLRAQYPALDFKIAWLGTSQENGYIKNILYDAQKCGIADRLLFIPANNQPLNIINRFDVFVLLSREDSFPLIVLEAASLGKPVIAFKNSGGIPELLEQGAGLLAPYLDIDALSRHIYQLRTDRQLRDKLGTRGRELIRTKYHTSAIAPGIYQIISRFTG